MEKEGSLRLKNPLGCDEELGLTKSTLGRMLFVVAGFCFVIFCRVWGLPHARQVLHPHHYVGYGFGRRVTFYNSVLCLPNRLLDRK
jgi:hypothetical protein